MKGSNPPELLVSSDLQQVLDNWRLGGEPPLPELVVSDPTYWTRFSAIDLRLVHHITTLSLDLYQRGYASCTPWAPKILTSVSHHFCSTSTLTSIQADSSRIDERFHDECCPCSLSIPSRLADKKF